MNMNLRYNNAGLNDEIRKSRLPRTAYRVAEGIRYRLGDVIVGFLSSGGLLGNQIGPEHGKETFRNPDPDSIVLSRYRDLIGL